MLFCGASESLVGHTLRRREKKRPCMYVLTRYNWNSFLYAFFVLVSDYVAPRPGVISGLSLLLALLLAPRGFLWVLRCSSLHKNQSQKSNVSKFQFDREFEGHGFLSRMTVILIFFFISLLMDKSLRSRLLCFSHLYIFSTFCFIHRCPPLTAVLSTPI